jgi:hypothetical protein
MSTTNKQLTYSFPPEFQDLLLSCILKFPAKFLAYQGVIQPQYFRSVAATVTAKAAFNFFQQRGHMPGFETLLDIVARESKRTEDEGLVEYVKKLRDMDVADVDYVAERAVAFARERATYLAVVQSIEKIKAGDVDGFTPLFEAAYSIGDNLDDLGYVLHMDVDKVVDQLSNVEYGTLTGYPAFDHIWRRGWLPGWLIVPLAPPKRYKTGLCLNLALNMVGPAINAPVFYYPCEISQELAMARLMCNLSQEPMDTLYDDPTKFKSAVKTAMKDRISNYLVIKSFPSGSATIGDIDRHVMATKRELGINPKAIFIDYAETVAYSPDVKNMPEYQQQASIYTQARALACKHHCPVIMPDRVTRETVDKKVPNMMSFQGAFRKAGIVDVALGLCATEQEYSQNILRTFVFVNRHGAAMEHFRGTVDPATMTIDIGSPIPYDSDDSGSESSHGPRGRRHQRDVDDRLAEED